jgi:catechol 2,3-dioxygenase-like lactoylglutathione lyase family enzyme
MVRGIDHIVHVVRDLEAVRALYERLGFQVGADNVHPWGTRNRLVQFPGSYIELLSIPEPEKLPRVPEGTYSFGEFNRAFLQACGEGLSFLVLQSRDPAAEKAAFDEAGFGGFPLMDFSRKALRPNGKETEVSFSLAFARDPKSKHTGFFTCLHRTPQEIWFAELQRHKNGAKGIAAAVFVAENPTDHHIFFEAFTGARDIRASSLGLTIETPQGEILIYDRRAFLDAFGTAVPKDDGLRFAGFILRVSNLGQAQKLLKSSGVKTRDMHGRLVMGPGETAGAVIAFEQPET